MGTPRKVVFPLIYILAALPGSGQESETAPADSVARSLGEVEVRATAAPARIDRTGAVTVTSGTVREAMGVMGESDVTRYLKAMPGVSSGSEYASGLSMHGADFSQTLYTINGAPVFFPYHFGGIFSTFHTTHFSKVRMEKSIHDSSFPDRLGGLVALSTSPSVREEAGGSVNVGMMASSATINVPAGEKLSITGSGRVSYIDALHGWMLRTDDTDVRYNLYDINLTAEYHPTPHDRITASGFLNRDRLKYTDTNYALDTRMAWSNVTASLGWAHTQGLPQTHTLYYSSMTNDLTLQMPNFSVKVPSSIRQGGLHGEFALPLPHNFTPLKWGYAAELTWISPQTALIEGYGSDTGTRNASARHFSSETRLFAEGGYNFTDKLTLNLGMKTSWWHNGGYNRVGIDPQATLFFRHGNHSIALQEASLHQYLHQVGFSDIGMASNFWLPSSAEIPPQRALSTSLAYTFTWGDGAYDLTAEGYYRRVYHQPEYDGFILNLLESGYDARDYVVNGNGYNTGGDLTLRKLTGRLTGQAGYSYSVGKRRFPGAQTGYVTAANEIRHSLSASATYRIDRHWSVQAAFDYSSGRPYTPVTALYFISESLVTARGMRNSSRLPAYHRLDLGGSYRFITRGRRRLTHRVSLSVINAYGHRNVEISSYVFVPEVLAYHRKEVASIYRFMPSLSYSIDF